MTLDSDPDQIRSRLVKRALRGLMTRCNINPRYLTLHSQLKPYTFNYTSSVSVVSAYAANGTNLYRMMMYEATQTHCYNPVASSYNIWAYCAHGWQRRCQEDPVSLPSGRLKKTTRSSPHHVAQHRPTGSETTPPYAPRSSRFGSEAPSVEDDVDV